MSVLHPDLVGLEIHVPHNFSYPTSIERLAATGFIATDLYKLALEEDTATLWMLTALTPTWVELTNSSGGTITGPGSSTDNAVVRWNGALGTDIQNSTAILNDDGSVEATIADALTTGLADALEVGHNSSGTPAATFGVGILAKAETDTTIDTPVGKIGFSWSDPAHASRRSGISFYGYNITDLVELGRIESSAYTSVAPDPRGVGAVDFGTFRGSAAYVASGQDSTISGGGNNTASGYRSTVSGGAYNTASGDYSSVGGGTSNLASGANDATIAGGNANIASGARSTVAGGNQNQATADLAFVGGGFNNQATDIGSVISGGTDNANSGVDSFVGGGNSNEVTSDQAVLVGGSNNTVSGYRGIIAGGAGNIASGVNSAVLNGNLNTASAYNSVAMGIQTEANKESQFAVGTVVLSGADRIQTTLTYLVKKKVTHNAATWFELYLDGDTATKRITIASDACYVFEALITGATTGLVKTFGFKIEGMIENDGGTTTLLASTVTTIYDTDDVSFDARARADDTADALVFEVQDADGAGDVVYWACTVKTIELEVTP